MSVWGVLGGFSRFCLTHQQTKKHSQSHNTYSGTAAEFAVRKYGWTDDGNFRHAVEFLRNSKEYNAYVLGEITRINKGLAKMKTMKRYHLLEKDFTDQGNMCELTPTQKVKHRVVKQKYEKVIRKVYGKEWKDSGTTKTADVLVDTVKLSLGAWPSNRTIIAALITTKDGKVLIDGKGNLPSVVLPDDSAFNVASSDNIRFVWTQQVCKMTGNLPKYVADRTKEDMNR